MGPLSDGYIRLVHWNEEEAPERAARLERLGYEVEATVPGTSIGIRELSANPPAAFVIDLSRLPSHGREVARAVRQSKGLRTVPILFLDGRPEKVAQAEDEFPDASFSPWGEAATALEEAISHPPADPVVPVSTSGPHSGVPLASKLGIKPGSTVVLLAPPEGFEQTLGELPEGAVLRRRNRGAREITLWFERSAAALRKRIGAVAEAVGEGMLWVAWPKGSSAIETDLSEGEVRATGLAAGLVDSKICAIDEDWSGLRFTRRRA